MKSWIKLWRKESAHFRSLPLAARAVASYVLKFVDTDGALPLGKRDVVTAVALAVSAEPSERRWLRPAVEALLAHEYLVVRDGLLVVGNFPRYQDETRRDGDARPTFTERSHDTSATVARRSPDVHRTLTGREISVSAGNHMLARDVLFSDSEKTQIQRESESARAPEGLTPRPKPRDPMGDTFRRHAPVPSDRVTCDDVAAVFSQMRHDAGGGKFKPTNRDDSRLLAAADFANENGTDRESRLRCLQTLLTGGMADEGAKLAGWPFAYVVGDVGKAHAAGLRLMGSAGDATDPVSVALAAADAAENACREARLRKEALAGLEGFSEASRAHAAMQRKLAEAKALVERLSA